MPLFNFDLKDAYKQLGIHESDRNKAVVVLKSDKHGGVDRYAMNCLPFGASSSAHNFNRVARFLWAIGVVELMPWVNYFDDYPVISPSGSAAKVCCTFWVQVCRTQAGSAQETAEVLGVNVDCSRVSKHDEIRYVMKESRAEVLESIETMFETGSLIPFDLPSMLGRVQFADGQLTGRSGKLATADFEKLA